MLRLNIRAEKRTEDGRPQLAFLVDAEGPTQTAHFPGSHQAGTHKGLTPREGQVLRFIVEGLTNKQIARELQVSVKTVEKHRQEIMNKLNIHHTAGLTCYALSNGMVFPSTVSASMARRVPSSRGNCSSPIEEAGHDQAITARETQVLRLIAEGFLNKQIASELRLSIKTVANHRQEVMKRLNIHHIAGLTRYAISKGLLNRAMPLAENGGQCRSPEENGEPMRGFCGKRKPQPLDPSHQSAATLVPRF
jgi:DNA-binding NarL/FixJ family response regulator